MSADNKDAALIPSTIMESRLTEKLRDIETLAPYLVVISGPDQGKQYKLDRQENNFGRSNDVSIVLSDPKVSRHHGAFIILPDSIMLEDYQSANGTYINGQRVTKTKVDLLSRIQVGNTHLKIEYKRSDEVESDQALYKAANHDPLTNVLNRGAFMAKAQQEVELSKKNHSLLSVVLCDVDHFKLKNDTFGHLAGDHILKELAAILTGHMRKDDLLGRYGGEEFIALLRDVDENEALLWGDRIRDGIASHPFEFQGQTMPTTMSVGICCRSGEQIESLLALIKSADDALYIAKHNGRNQVVLN